MLTLLIVAAIAFATLQSLFSRLYSDHYPRRTGMASALAYAVFYGAFIGLATEKGPICKQVDLTRGRSRGMRRHLAGHHAFDMVRHALLGMEI